MFIKHNRWQIPALGAALALPLAAFTLADETSDAPPVQPSGQSVELNPQDNSERQQQEQDQNRIDAVDQQAQPAQQNRSDTQQQRVQASPQDNQAQGKQATLQGKLVWFEQYMMHGGEGAASAAPSGIDMLVLKTDQGLVMLSHDTMRHLRAGSHAALRDQPAAQEDVVAIERREEQQASSRIEKGQAQQSQQQDQQPGESSDLTLQSDDPDAQFRIVQGDEAQVAAGDWELREGDSATRISRSGRGDEELNQSYGIERRSSHRSVIGAAGKEASITGKLYEKDGVRFLKVESIQLQEQPSE